METGTTVQNLEVQPAPGPEEVEASRRIRRAAWAGLVSTVATALLGAAGFFVTEAEGRLAWYLDPWMLLDATLMAILTFFMFRESFAASVLIVLYWLVSLISTTAVGVSSPNLVNLLFLYFFVNGTRGAWYLRKLRGGPVRSRLKTTVIWTTGSIAVSLALVLVALGTLVETGHLPDTLAIPGENLQQSTRTVMEDNGFLDSDEQVIYFYSAGFLSFLDDGNLLTDRRVVSWWMNEADELESSSVALDQIRSAEISFKGDELTDSYLTIVTRDGGELLLVVSTEEDGDVKFLNALNAHITSSADITELPVPGLGDDVKIPD